MKNLFTQVTLKEFLHHIAVFFIILAAAKFGQYLFFEWQTSPAILWPPTGIALAIMWLGGYRFAISIFLGLLTASATGPVAHVVPAVVTTPLAQVAGHIVGAYLLRRFNFNGSFLTMRDFAVFLGVIIVACMVAPTITTLISIATSNLTTAPYISWSRAWVGYLFSCLILFPLIVTWAKPDKYWEVRSYLETVIVASMVALSVYLLFWTRIAETFSFMLFAIFFISHFWICLRYGTPIVALTMVITTAIGFLGLFIFPAPGKALNQQLFASELFLFLVIPIFYAFSALVKERAVTIIELQAAMRCIEAENELKSEFIAVLAHELRNPLAPVKTTLEILSMMHTLPIETQTLVEKAHSQVHTMRRLLDDLLDMTRVTQGKFSLQIERLQLCKLIDVAVESTSTLFIESNHTLVHDAICDDSIWIDVDPVRFEQVLVNILNNSAKYTEPGGTITISHSVYEGKVCIAVTDTGRGLAQEHIAEVFEPFWQVKSAGPHTGSGIGVGLSLTRHIVELHGGTIHAESMGLNQGSTFVVTLPLAAYGAQHVPEKKVATRALVSNLRILVVDDNEAAANSMAKLLSLKGHTSDTAYSGRDVFTLAPEFKPEVILLDIGLPDISGYIVASTLRERGFTGQIIALSGYGQQEDKDNARRAGFDHHLTKPMTFSRLEEYLVSIGHYKAV